MLRGSAGRNRNRSIRPVFVGPTGARTALYVFAVLGMLVGSTLGISAGMIVRPGASSASPLAGVGRAPSSAMTVPLAAGGATSPSLPVPAAETRAPVGHGAPSGVAVDGKIGSGKVGTGAFPYGGTYDPVNQEVYIANQDGVDGDNVTVLNGTTGRHVTDISTGGFDPLGAVYVGWNNRVYVNIENNSSVAVIDPTTNKIIRNIPLAGEPEYMVYDPDNQQLYATVWTPAEAPIGMQALNTTTNSTSPAVTVGFDGPYCLTVDTQDNTVWAENLGNDTISVLSAAENKVIRWVHPGPQPTGATLTGGIAYTPVGDQIFFVNYAASVDTVNVVRASSYTLIASGISVGAQAYGASVTYDPASECMYVASYATDTITVISVLTDASAEPTITQAGEPWVGIYDNTTGALFFLLSASPFGAAWLFGGINVEFTAVGLPVGTSWAVTANGTPLTGTRTTLSIVEPVGSGPYSVPPIAGYVLANASGTFVVPSSPVAPVTVPIVFSLPTYTVQFTEQGLPTDKAWEVRLGQQLLTGSAGTPVSVQELNGSYPYIVPGVPGFIPTEPTGEVNVTGANVSVTVVFIVATFPVKFTENGLPAGTTWSVDLNGSVQASGTTTITFSEANGSYAYSVTSTNPTYGAVGGLVTVDGPGPGQTVAFSRVTFSVAFTETGLPVATNWTVVLNGSSATSAGATITFQVPNGTYVYTVAAETGFTLGTFGGSVTVNGANATRSVSFTANATSSNPTFLGLPANEGYAVAGGILAALVVVAGGVVLLRSRPKAPAAPEADPGPAPEGESAPSEEPPTGS